MLSDSVTPSRHTGRHTSELIEIACHFKDGLVRA